jgi:protein-glutamine gamma-glutamyltransferase
MRISLGQSGIVISKMKPDFPMIGALRRALRTLSFRARLANNRPAMATAGKLRPLTASLPGALQRYFEVALYLLVVTGFGTLASTGGLGVGTVALVSSALLFRGYLLFQGRTWLIPERWTAFLTLGYVAFYLADYFLISGGFLNATVHLVLFVMVVRLFSAQRERDFYFLSVIAFLMVLASALLTVDSAFLLAFAAFMLMAVVCFILMEMRHISAKAGVHARESGVGPTYKNMATSLAVASPVLVLCILLGAAAIFFLLPRASAGYLGASAPGGEISTGFGDTVELGRIGEIQQSGSVVMHVQIDGDEQGSFDLKWRGVALGKFDGRIWSNNRAQHPLFRKMDGRFVFPPPAGIQKATPRLISYRVLMEAVGMNVFFLAGATETLEGFYGHLAMDDGGAVFDLDPEHPVNRYRASSDIEQVAASDLRTAGDTYPPEVVSSYLQLPALDSRIPQLAAQITASAGNDYDKARAVEAYLRTHFGYTLQLSRTVPHDPLANFLFERKQGHCEYFASSMAVILRTLGIPSRVVNGFRTGEFNDLTSQYVVRASNAHSWVEAYFPNHGWVAFDPTPGASFPARTGWSRVSLYLDAMASFWREWIVNYDVGHQQSLAVSAGNRSRQVFAALRRWWHRHYMRLLAGARHTGSAMAGSPLRWSLGGGLVAALLVFVVNARGLLRSLGKLRLAARPEKSPRRAATIWYERMTQRLARRGWRKLPTQTPDEFLCGIDDARVRQRVAEFTRHYQSARFDDSVEDVRRLPELYEQISGNRRR